jgi:hypothetical protein
MHQWIGINIWLGSCGFRYNKFWTDQSGYRSINFGFGALTDWDKFMAQIMQVQILIDFGPI